MEHSGTELEGLIDEVITAANLAGGPDGWPVRLLLATNLYGAFDHLRSREAPFDRAGYAEHLRQLAGLVAVFGRSESSTPPKPVSELELEAKIADLYSRCWANYGDQAFLESVDLFAERFAVNEVDLDFLRGARCLDAGCGSGRYTIAMARCGAREVVGVDLSQCAVEWASAMARRLGVTGVEFLQGSVLDLPTDWSGRFDFVCSNGVVHHTRDPRTGLREIFRVLRPGGTAYILVYGAGGLYWSLVDRCRALLAPVPVDVTENWLKVLGMPEGKIFHFMDHWYVPIQERVTRAEFEERLQSCGFTDMRYLPRGRIYEGCERIVRYPDERDIFGESELRYLVRKPGP